MKNKNYVIHRFENPAFPRKLYIVKNAPYEWIDAHFRTRNGESLERVSPNDARAVTYSEVEHLETKHLGILIVMFGKMELSDFAHEATHYALSLLDAIGDAPTTANQEVLAYLIGWATDCQLQAYRNKFKD